MLKKAKLLLLTVFVLSVFTFMGVSAYAANSATVALTALDDDATTKVAGLTVAVFDGAGNAVTTQQGITITETSGVYTIANITTKGAYDIRLTSSTGISVTVPVSVTSLAATPTTKAVKATFIENASKLDVKKSGVLGGLALNASGAALSDVVVKAYTSTGITYATTTDSKGFYKLYLPTGTYTVVVYGKDSTGVDDHKNLYSTVKITAGQMSGPLEDMNAQTDWTNDAVTAGYSITQLTTDNKTVKGYANKNSTVSIYSVDGSGKYTLLGSKKVTSTTGAAIANGAFSIALADYIAGGSKVSVKVTDLGFNVYEDKSRVDTPMANRTMTLTVAAPSTSANTINTPVVITYVDAGLAAMTTNLTAKVTTVTAVGVTTAGSITLVKGTDYTVSGGKITIDAGLLNLAQDYAVTVQAIGYTSKGITVKVGPSVKAAAAITGFTAAAGSVPGTTKLSAIGTAATGNSFKYQVSNSITPQKAGNPATSVSAVALNADISGVDATTNKYLHVYEVKNSDNTVVGVKTITLTAAMIKAPSIIAAYANGTTITLIADATLKTTAPANTVFAVKAGANAAATTTTVVKAVSGVTISGKVITITVASLTTGTAVTVNYTKPGATANPLADASSNAVASFTAKAAVNVTTATDAGNTTAPAITLGATTVTLGNTLSVTSNEVGTLYLVPQATAGNLTALNATLSAGTGSAVKAIVGAALIPTVGLTSGTYVVYGVDYAGNISTVSSNVTVSP